MPGLVEHFLQPGDVAFGGRHLQLRTVLGSCVALVFWHRQRLLGGMCHYMLPCRCRQGAGGLNGRYAAEALALLFEFMGRAQVQPGQFSVSVFGGSDMFPGVRRSDGLSIGQQNVNAARGLIKAHGLVCAVYHVGGQGYRSLVFDVGTGRVQLKYADGTLSPFESPGSNTR